MGPATITRKSRWRIAHISGRLTISANKPSVGTYMIPKSVVLGGSRYLSRIDFAISFALLSNCFEVCSISSRSHFSRASRSRSKSSFGNFASIGRNTSFLPLSSWPGSFNANSTLSLLPLLVATFFAYWPGVITCSSMFSSCHSATVPLVFTLLKMRLRSPTPDASDRISPNP